MLDRTWGMKEFFEAVSGSRCCDRRSHSQHKSINIGEPSLALTFAIWGIMLFITLKMVFLMVLNYQKLRSQLIRGSLLTTSGRTHGLQLNNWLRYKNGNANIIRNGVRNQIWCHFGRPSAKQQECNETIPDYLEMKKHIWLCNGPFVETSVRG